MRNWKVMATTILVAVAVALQGCANLESTAEPDWESPMKVASGSDTALSTDGSRLVVNNTREFGIIDTESGQVLSYIGDDDGFLSNLTLDRRIEPEFTSTVPLHHSGIVLVFDHEGTTEYVRAFDFESGEELWEVTDYDYSLQRYEGLINEARDRVVSSAARSLGVQAQRETHAQRATRQRNFITGLVAPVPESDTFFFKTFDGLEVVDARTGQRKKMIREFMGPGILDMQQLDDGDLVLLSKGQDLSAWQVADAYTVARISPDGEVRWVSEHSGTDTTGLYLSGNRVIIDGSPLEAFDLMTGEKLWDNDGVRLEFTDDQNHDERYLPPPPPVLSEGAVFQAANVAKEESFALGFPAHRVRSYDIDTGELRWTTGDTDTYFGAVEKRDGHIVVWGVGEMFGDTGGVAALDVDTGEVLWTSPKMERPGAFARSAGSQWIFGPVYDERRQNMIVSSQDELVGLDSDSGEVLFNVSLDDLDIGWVRDIAYHQGVVAIVGVDGVAGYDATDGSLLYEVETDRVLSFAHRGERLLLRVQAVAMGGMATSNDYGLLDVHIGTGELGNMITYDGSIRARGAMSTLPGGVYVSDDGERIVLVGKDRHITGYRR